MTPGYAQRHAYRPDGNIATLHNKYYPRSPRFACAVQHTDHSIFLLHAHFSLNKSADWRRRALRRVDDLLGRRENQIVTLGVYSPEKAEQAKRDGVAIEIMFKPLREAVESYA